MTTAGFVLFAISSVIAFFSAIATVGARVPLRAALFLMVHIISLAGLYLTLSAHMLAAVQLLVYAGAVVVLFVFVIMLIGPASETKPTMKNMGIRLVSLIGMILFTVTLAFALVSHAADWVAIETSFGTVEAVGHELYLNTLVPFEVVSATLTVAIVGAVAIARKATEFEVGEAKAARQATIDALEEARQEAA